MLYKFITSCYQNIYQKQSCEVSSLINSKNNLLIFLTIGGIEDVQVVVNPEYREWFAHDQNLLSWIYNLIEPLVASELICYETFRQLWDTINDLFEVKTRSCMVFCKRKFVKMQNDNMKMEKYLKTMNNLVKNYGLASHLVSLK